MSDVANAVTQGIRSVFIEWFGAPGANKPPTPGAPAGGASNASSGVSSDIVTNIKNSAGGFADLAKSVPAVAASFKTMGDSSGAAINLLQTMASMSPILGSQLTGLVSGIANQQKALQAAANIGIGGANAPAMQSSLNRAGYTVAEGLEHIARSQVAIRNLGGNAEVSANRLNKLQEETQNTELGKMLKVNAQLPANALADAATVMASHTKLNLGQVENQKRLAQSSAELAAQIDLTARQTGKSREEITAELAARLQSTENQMAMNQMNESQRAAYIKTQAGLTGLGKNVQDLGDAMVQGARLTDQNKQTMLAMGPAAKEFRLAMAMQKFAGDDPVKQKMAADQLAKSQQVLAAYQSSAQYQRFAATAKGTPLGGAMTEMYGQNIQRQPLLAQQRETGGTLAQAQQEQVRGVLRRQQGQTLTGEVDTSMKPQQLIGKFTEDARINAAAGSEAMNRFNTELGKSPKLLNKVSDALEILTGKSGQTVDQRTDANINVVKKGVDMLGGTTGSSKVPTGAPQAGTKLEPLKRQDGSLGAVGKYIEDFGKGTPAILHGREGVITEKQFNDLLGKVKAPDIKIPRMPDINFKQPKFEPPKIDIPPMGVDASTKNTSDTLQSAEGEGGDSIMKDILSSLERLNMTMGRVASGTESISEASSKTARMTSKMTGNRAAI